MSRWFRHYAGMMRDDKLVGAAIRSKQPVERVVWIWGAILESASEINDGGIYRLDCAEVAYFLRADEADIRAVIDALAAAGRVDADRVVKWSDRQFKSDQSAERQARYRDKKRGTIRDGDDQPPMDDGGVTLQSRDSDAPETDTELEANTEANTARPILDPGARDLFSELVEAFPANPSSSETKARNAFDRLTPMERAGAVAAAERYARWFGQDCEARGRTIDAGLSFVPHLSTWLAGGQWREASKLPVKGEVDPDIVVIVKGDDDFAALERHRGKPIKVFTDNGHYAVSRAELEQARAGPVH